MATKPHSSSQCRQLQLCAICFSFVVVVMNCVCVMGWVLSWLYVKEKDIFGCLMMEDGRETVLGAHANLNKVEEWGEGKARP